MNYPSDTLDIQQMPLSLQLERPKFYGLVCGAGVAGDLFSWGDFTVHAKAGWQYIRGNDKQWNIALSAAAGTADISSAIHLFTAGLQLVYNGLNDMTIFAGPELFLIKGHYGCSEAISPTGDTTVLSGSQELAVKQKKWLGINAGAIFEIGDNWQVVAQCSLLSRTAVSAAFYYNF